MTFQFVAHPACNNGIFSIIDITRFNWTSPDFPWDSGGIKGFPYGPSFTQSDLCKVIHAWYILHKSSIFRTDVRHGYLATWTSVDSKKGCFQKSPQQTIQGQGPSLSFLPTTHDTYVSSVEVGPRPIELYSGIWKMFQRRRKDQRFPILVKSYHPPTQAAGIQPFFTYERDPAGMEVFSGWNQLMVNWCFGLAVWIPRIPLCFRDCYLGVPREIPNHQPKPPSTDTNLFVSEKKTSCMVGRWLVQMKCPCGMVSFLLTCYIYSCALPKRFFLNLITVLLPQFLDVRLSHPNWKEWNWIISLKHRFETTSLVSDL